MVGPRSGLLTILIVTSIVAIAVATGWAIARSPSSEHMPAPTAEAAPLFAEAVMQEISVEVVTRGTARFGAERTVEYRQPTQSRATAPVVLEIVERGETVSEGDVLFSISGRPTFMMYGDLPLMRVATRGSVGEDIVQLQSALSRLGLYDGTVDGVLGPATEKAVRMLFEQAGYESLGSTEAETLATEQSAWEVRRLRLSLEEGRDANHRIDSVEQELTVRSAGLDQALRLEEVASQRERQAIEGVHPDTGLPATTSQLEALRSEVVVAEANTIGVELAVNDLVERLASLDRVETVDLERDLKRALAIQSRTRLSAGLSLDPAEFLFVDQLELQVSQVFAERGDVAEGPLLSLSDEHVVVAVPVSSLALQHLDFGSHAIVDYAAREYDARFVGLAPALDDPTQGELAVFEMSGSADELANRSVRVRIPIASSDGPVLAVPAGAITTRADGTTIVRLAGPDGSSTDVRVTTGLSADGLVEIKPLSGTLEPGVRLLLGVRYTEDSP